MMQNQRYAVFYAYRIGGVGKLTILPPGQILFPEDHSIRKLLYGNQLEALK